MARPVNDEIIAKIETIVAEQLQKNSPEAISMRKIAKLAGITATTIYYYFKDKEELFLKIKLDGFQKLRLFIESSINNKESFSQQIESIIRAFINWVENNSYLADLMFDKAPPDLNLTDEQEAQYYSSLFLAVDILNKGKEAGEFFFEDALLETTLVFAWMYGITKLSFNKRLPKKYWNDNSLLVDKFIDITISSLKKTKIKRGKR